MLKIKKIIPLILVLKMKGLSVKDQNVYSSNFSVKIKDSYMLTIKMQ